MAHIVPSSGVATSRYMIAAQSKNIHLSSHHRPSHQLQHLYQYDNRAMSSPSNLTASEISASSVMTPTTSAGAIPMTEVADTQVSEEPKSTSTKETNNDVTGKKPSPTEFLRKKATFSYLTIFVCIAGVMLLLVSVGLIVGLTGPSNDCGTDDAFFSTTQGAGQVERRSVPYERSKPWTNPRLSRDIIPKRYKLDMSPYFYTDSEDYFNGKSSIEAAVHRPTRYVIVHAKEITINSFRIHYIDGRHDLDVKKHFYFPIYEYFVIEMSKPLTINRTIEIGFTFNGSLANTYEGFYKAPFRLPGSGEKVYAVMTQFEPQAARKTFPCFDEPNMKAFFAVQIRHKSGMTAFSNMRIDTVNKHGNGNEDLLQKTSASNLPVISRFKETEVPMSTYLVAMVVGPYTVSKCRSTSFNLPVCVYAPHHLGTQLQFALDSAVRGMEFQQNFFDIKYPLPKVDLIVYPEFRSYAMENWGLISFREEALLVSPESTGQDKDVVMSVVLHELAHQWFGNLVTMDWWDDLWLNEGFASYMEFPSCQNQGRLKNGEEYRDFLSAIALDCRESTRQIRVVDIKTGHDIQQAFDSVTYRKGSSIIRMLVGAMGMEKFRDGIRYYMKEHQFKNARTTDLWKSLSRFDDRIDIPAAMSSWIEQKGFPLVDVEVAPDKRQLILRQQRFVLPQWPKNETAWEKRQHYPQSARLETPPPRWHIPIVYWQRNKANTTTTWLPPNGLAFTLNIPEGFLADNFKINIGQTAFIRVNYPLSTWQNFAQRLAANIDSFAPLDRAGLLDDCLELAKAGRVPYSTVFTFLRFLKDETHPMVWEAAWRHITHLRYRLYDSPQYGLYQKFVLGIIRSARTLVLQSTSSTKPQVLADLAELSLSFKQQQEIRCYSQHFMTGAWKTPQYIDMRKAVFLAYLLSDDSETTVNELLTIANQTNVRQVQKSVFYAIARTKNTWLLVRELEKVYTGEVLPPYFLSLAGYASNSPASREFMWSWVRENFWKLKPIFGGPTRKFMAWVASVARQFDTTFHYAEMEDFVKFIGELGAGERPTKQVKEEISNNIYWRMKIRKDAEAALLANSDFIESLAKRHTQC